MTIGILAGMGPKSTGPFVDQVVGAFQSIAGARCDSDFPPMMIYSLPTPFYLDRPIDHALMEKTICGGLQKLEACGASFVAMPCNTAHLYFDALQRSIRIPLLNIVNETLARIPKKAKEAALLATRPTIESEIYQTGLKKAGLICRMEPEWQQSVDSLLKSIKETAHPDTQAWNRLLRSLKEAHVDAAILACTDLNVLLKDSHSPLPVIDSAACLAEAVVRKWQEL